jgi:hypothetical protein
VRVLFLDIDGVLNKVDTNHCVTPTAQELLPIPIEPDCMTRLNHLIAETGCKIVISSSWRNFARWQDLGPALNRHGLVGDVIGETPYLINDAQWLERWRARDGAPFTYERMERGWEIREWIARYANACATCGHPSDVHECGTDECFHNDTSSGASGCLCRRFVSDPLTHFVILDDCSDMAELKPWLTLTHPIDGLDDPDVERAKWLLEVSGPGIALAKELAIGYDITRRDPPAWALKRSY